MTRHDGSPPDVRTAAILAVLTVVILVVGGEGSGLPHNDAGAYHRMVDLWVRTGHPVFIGWNEMTLLGHLALGRLASGIGLSGVASRQWLTGLMAVGTVLLLLSLVRGIRPGSGRAVASFGALVWLANPVALLAATSFMTGVPTTFWTAAALWSFARWTGAKGNGWAVPTAAAAIMAFSVRQTAVVLAPALALPLVLLPAHRRRWREAAVLGVAVLLADAGIWALRSRLPLATIRPIGAMADRALASILLRGLEAVALSALLLLPVVLLVVPVSRRRLAAALGGGLAVGGLLVLLGRTVPFWGNVLTDRGLLPDLLPPHAALPAVVPPGVLVALTLLAGVAAALVAAGGRWRTVLATPAGCATALAVGGFLAAAVVPERPFDRYLVPVLALAGALAVMAAPEDGARRRVRRAAGVLLTVFLALGSLGSRMVHERQRRIWTFASVFVEKGVPAQRIDGGFEWNLWYQPVPFHPGERRDPRTVLVWYEVYPFTRLDPVVRLWVGTPPPGWIVSDRRDGGPGPVILALVPSAR